MKKIFPLTSLMLAALLMSSCTVGEDYCTVGEDYNDDVHYYPADMEKAQPFLGIWTLTGCDVTTTATVSDFMGVSKEVLNGHDTYTTDIEWAFTSLHDGTINIGDTYLNPLIPLSKQFRWDMLNESNMSITMLEDVTGSFLPNSSYAFTICWPDLGEYSSVHASYAYDRLQLTIHYQREGKYEELDRYYYSYIYNNSRYDGTGCTYVMDVVVTYMLNRR